MPLLIQTATPITYIKEALNRTLNHQIQSSYVYYWADWFRWFHSWQGWRMILWNTTYSSHESWTFLGEFNNIDRRINGNWTFTHCNRAETKSLCTENSRKAWMAKLPEIKHKTLNTVITTITLHRIIHTTFGKNINNAKKHSRIILA